MDLNNVTGWNFTGNLWVPPQQNEARVRINWNEMNEAVSNAVKKENGLWKVKFGNNPTAVFFSKDQAQKFAERQYHNSITGQASVFNARPTAIQQPVIQQPTVQPTAVQQPVIQQPTVQPTAVQQPVIQQPTAQPTVSNAQPTVAQQQAIQQPTVQPQTNNTAQITPRKKYTWSQYAQEHGTTYTKPPKSGAVIADERAAQIIAKNAEEAAQQTITLTPSIPTKPKYIEPTSSYLSDNIANTPAVETTIQEAPITSEAVGTDKMQTATKAKTQLKKGSTLKTLKKVGKWGALTALVIGTVITAVQACKGGQKDDAVKPQTEAPKPETPKSEAPKKETSATAPVKEDAPANTTAPTPAAPATPTEPEKSSEIGVGEFKDGKYKVIKGDSFWNIAEKNLIEEYKKAQTAKNEAIDENYKPTDAEIMKETERLVAKNEYEFDEKHWNTTKPIYEGDILNIAA